MDPHASQTPPSQPHQEPPLQPPTPETQSPLTQTPPAPPTKETPSIVYIGLILAFVVPLAGLIVSIIAWRKVSKASLGGKIWAIAGTVISAVSIVLSVLFLLIIFSVFGGIGTLHNGAESAAKPITTDITKQLGGKKICSGGDSGSGLDNTVPWYQAYYEIPAESNANNKIKNIIAQAGYQIAVDTVHMANGQNQQVTSSYIGGSSASETLTGHNGDNTLSIDIINRGIVPLLNCHGSDSGGQPVPSGGAIVSINVQLPDRNR